MSRSTLPPGFSAVVQARLHLVDSTFAPTMPGVCREIRHRGQLEPPAAQAGRARASPVSRA